MSIFPTVVIEEHTPDGVEWGLSFTDNNPEPEHYFKMPDKETAFRLKDYLAVYAPVTNNEPVGLPPNKL